MNEEQVGYCCICGESIVCRGGFLNGEVGDDGQLYCMTCFDDKD